MYFGRYIDLYTGFLERLTQSLREAFLILRSRTVGLPVALAPFVLVVMNLLYAAAAYPAGVLSDRFGRRSVLDIGIGFLIVADVVLGLGST